MRSETDAPDLSRFSTNSEIGAKMSILLGNVSPIWVLFRKNTH